MFPSILNGFNTQQLIQLFPVSSELTTPNPYPPTHMERRSSRLVFTVPPSDLRQSYLYIYMDVPMATLIQANTISSEMRAAKTQNVSLQNGTHANE